MSHKKELRNNMLKIELSFFGYFVKFMVKKADNNG